jgi:hypothetical protein
MPAPVNVERFCVAYVLRGGVRGRTPPSTSADGAMADLHAIEAECGRPARFAALMRDSGGKDHAENVGKFFLHRYIRA